MICIICKKEKLMKWRIYKRDTGWLCMPYIRGKLMKFDREPKDPDRYIGVDVCSDKCRFTYIKKDGKNESKKGTDSRFEKAKRAGLMK